MTNWKTLLIALLVATVAACGQQPADTAANADQAKAAAADSTASAASEAAVTARQVASDIDERMAKADPQKGSRLYLQCRACHTLEQGGTNKVGPNLHGVFDNQAGRAADFVYSDALANADVTWNAGTMDLWLERPAEMIPGNRMVFVGVRDPQARADLIAYLMQETAN